MGELRSSGLSGLALTGTSIGNIVKWNKVQNGVTYFIKASSLEGKTFTNREPISEYVASIIGHQMNLDIVETFYREITVSATSQYREQDCIISYTADFVKEDEIFIPFVKLVKIDKFSYDSPLWWISRFKEDINKMLIFDFIIGNYDRHLNNFGVVLKKDKSEVKFSTIFDNGSSLLANYSDLDLKEMSPKDVDRDMLAKPFKSNHFEQIELVKELPKGLNLDIDLNIVKSAIDEFSLDISSYRRKRILNLVERRLHFVKEKFK